MKKILKMMSRKTKAELLILMVVSVVSSYLSSLWPVLFAGVVDGISSGGYATVEALLPALGRFAGCCALAKLLSIGLRVGSDVSAAGFEASMRSGGFLSALGLPPSSPALGRHSAELGAIVGQGVEGCSQLYKMIVKDAVPVVLTVAFIAFQCASAASPVFLAIISGYIALSVAVSAIQIRSQNGIRDSLNLRRARLNGDIAQSLGHHEVIRSMSTERDELDRLSGQIGGIASLEKTHHRAMGGYDAVKQLLVVLLFTIAALVGFWNCSQGALSAGSVVSVLLLLEQLVVPVDAVYRLLDESFTSKNKVDRLLEIVREADASRTADEALRAPAVVDYGSAAIEAWGVEALSPRGDAVSERVDFRIESGSFARLDGPTGCGKSSLLKGLLGYYGHTGDILLYGEGLSGYSKRQISDLMLYLPQESFVFSGTVRENLLYGLEGGRVPDRDLVCALSKAQFSPDEVGDLFRFLDRELPENGRDLSGGQRQRLQAARLFLRSPKILLADEPTASLDIPTAEALMREVRLHMSGNGGTVVFISHQEQVQAMADATVVVGKGQQSMQEGCGIDGGRAAA